MRMCAQCGRLWEAKDSDRLELCTECMHNLVEKTQALAKEGFGEQASRMVLRELVDLVVKLTVEEVLKRWPPPPPVQPPWPGPAIPLPTWPQISDTSCRVCGIDLSQATNYACPNTACPYTVKLTCIGGDDG